MLVQLSIALGVVATVSAVVWSIALAVLTARHLHEWPAPALDDEWLSRLRGDA